MTIVKRRRHILKSSALLLAVAVLTSAILVAQRQVYEPGDGVTLPIVVKEVKPTYTDKAKAQKLQGAVLLTTVVEDDGSVDEIVVVRSLDPELDQQAIDALKQWKFKPGTKEDKTVAVRITCELVFTLPR